MKKLLVNVPLALFALCLVAAPRAHAVLFEKDCASVTLFKKAHPKLTAQQCATKGGTDGDFFAGTLPNANKTHSTWATLPVCLGFAADINTYLTAHPDACRRLSAREACGADKHQHCWTEELNQEFLQCVADGHLSHHAPIWTTSTAEVSKKDWNDKSPEWEKRNWSDGWKKVVTASEMCFIYAVNKTWVVGVSK